MGTRVSVDNELYLVVSTAAGPVPHAALEEITEGSSGGRRPPLRCAERELQQGQVVWRDSFPERPRVPPRVLFASTVGGAASLALEAECWF